MAISEQDRLGEPTALIELLSLVPDEDVLDATPAGLRVPNDREHGHCAGWFETNHAANEPPEFEQYRLRMCG